MFGKSLNQRSFILKDLEFDQDLPPGKIPDWEEILVKIQEVLNG